MSRFFTFFNVFIFFLERFYIYVSTGSLISPVGRLLKFSNVRLNKLTVGHVPVQLAILVNELLNEIHRLHRLRVFAEKTSESPEKGTIKLSACKCQ